MLCALRFSLLCLLGALLAFPTWGQTAEPLGIRSVQTLRTTGTSATFAISSATPDPCWARWPEVQVEGSEVSVRLMGRDSGAICIQVVDFFVDTTTVNVPQPGTYTFSFWQSPSKKLRRTLHLEPITGATLGANYPNPVNPRTVIPYEVQIDRPERSTKESVHRRHLPQNPPPRSKI